MVCGPVGAVRFKSPGLQWERALSMLDDMNHQDTGCSGGWVVVYGIDFSFYQLTVTKRN